MNDGTRVTTPAQWKKRRAEIKAMFDEYVYGKYPAHIPQVTWKVDSVETMTVQGIPAIVKHVTGHVDNSSLPRDHCRHPCRCGDAGQRPKANGYRSSLAAARFVRARFSRGPPAVPGQVVHQLSAPPDAPDSAKLLAAARLGFCRPQLQRGAGRQRRRPRQGHHRPGQQGPAALAGRLGRAARLGLGRQPIARLSRNRSRCRWKEGRRDGPFARRQGGAGSDGR